MGPPFLAIAAVKSARRMFSSVVHISEIVSFGQRRASTLSDISCARWARTSSDDVTLATMSHRGHRTCPFCSWFCNKFFFFIGIPVRIVAGNATFFRIHSDITLFQNPSSYILWALLEPPISKFAMNTFWYIQYLAWYAKRDSARTPNVLLLFYVFKKITFYISYYVMFILIWSGAYIQNIYTKIKYKLVVIVFAESVTITL